MLQESWRRVDLALAAFRYDRDEFHRLYVELIMGVVVKLEGFTTWRMRLFFVWTGWLELNLQEVPSGDRRLQSSVART